MAVPAKRIKRKVRNWCRPCRQGSRLVVRLLAPGDAADLIEESPQRERDDLMNLMDENTRKDVRALLDYRRDVAAGLMDPRFARLRPEASIDEAMRGSPYRCPCCLPI